MSTQSIDSSGVLRIVCCPQCGLKLLRLVSKSERNPGKVFYKCPNFNAKYECKFFKWEKDYKDYLYEIGVLTTENETTDELIGIQRIESRMNDVLEQLNKNERSRQVEAIEKIKILVAINTIVVINILVVMILNLLMK